MVSSVEKRWFWNWKLKVTLIYEEGLVLTHCKWIWAAIICVYFPNIHGHISERLIVVGPEAEPTETPIGTPAPTSPHRPIKPEEHYLRRQLSQSQRTQRRITDDLSLLMAEGDKFWYGLKCCTTIIVTILTAILLLVILRWVLYK